MEAAGPPAGLPRALDVQRFAGAREQEIRALCSAIQKGPLGAKFGVAALPRHLRRRAGSHKPFHAHRFRPNAKLQGKRLKLTAGEADTASGGGEQAKGADTEPAAAAEALSDAQAAGTAVRPFTNRRMRRTPAALAEQHRRSAAWYEASLLESTVAAAGGSSSGGVGEGRARRLETHVWHAKRLSMEQRYGWVLPAGAAGQGRGSRSFVHEAQASCLMHDSSYLCPLLLSGPWSGVHDVLSVLLAPEDAAEVEAEWRERSSSSSGSSPNSQSRDIGRTSSCYGSSSSVGSSVGWEREVVLHHPGRYPQGAICPAQLLFAPCGSSASTVGAGGQAMEIDGQGATAAGAGAAAAIGEAAAAAAAAAGVEVGVWVHPAAAAEARGALRLAIVRQAAGTASDSNAVRLAVLDLRRIELRGGAADAALSVALAGTTAGGVQQRAAEQALQQVEQRGQQQQPKPQDKGRRRPALPRPRLPLPLALAQLRHGEAVQSLLPDPRLRKPVALGSAAASLLPGSLSEGTAATAAAAVPAEVGPDEVGGQPEQLSLNLQSLLQAPLPLSEAELSSRRQQLRRRMLQLGTEPADAAASGDGQQREQEVEQQREQEVERRGYCPAVLVRHDPAGDGGIPGWSLILPPGWVPPFWLAAAYAGCKPAGQREWRWLHALQQRSCFPWDHPDTASYACLMQQQQQLRTAAASKRPPGKRVMAAPSLPPTWQQLLGPAAGQAAGPAAGQQQQQQQQTGQQQLQQQQQTTTTTTGQQQDQQPPQPMDDGPEAALATAGAVVPDALAGATGVSGSGRSSSPASATPTITAPSMHPMFVARTYAAMAASLQGRGSSGRRAGSSGSGDFGVAGLPPSRGSRPVAAALRQGRLEWRPKQQQMQQQQQQAGREEVAVGAAAAAGPAEQHARSEAALGENSGRCLLEAAVYPVQAGTPSEGAAICLVAGWEAQRCRRPLQVLGRRQQRRRQRELEERREALLEVGGDPVEASWASTAAAASVGGGNGVAGEVGEEQVCVIGWVLSEVPRGAPRRCGALVAVDAAAAWRLRSLQYWGAVLDGGIRAFARNRGSAALFPVRMQLLVEQMAQVM